MAYADHHLSHLTSKQNNLKTHGRRTEAFRRRIVDVQPVAAEPFAVLWLMIWNTSLFLLKCIYYNLKYRSAATKSTGLRVA